MDNFLHRLKIFLIGEAGLIVFGLVNLVGTGLLFTVSPIMALLFFAVVSFVGLRFMKWIRVQDAYYLDTEGRVRCRKCRKLAFDDGASAHGVAEDASSRGAYLRAYYENRCGNWHLTSQAPR